MMNTFTPNPILLNLIRHQFKLLQDNYSKLLPVRVDFHYEKGLVMPSDKAYKAYSDMLMLYCLLKSEMSDVVGLAFVTEYSSTDNLHIHAIFYVNGQLHQRYYPIYQKINTLWLTKIRSTLSTHDCNAKQEAYTFNALKNLSYNNEFGNDSLDYVFEYMSKNEQKENIPQIFKCFTSNVVPKSNRGRPRKYS